MGADEAKWLVPSFDEVVVTETTLWLQIVVSGLTQGSLFGLIAIGFNIIFNVAAMPNFAQAEFSTIAAFLAFYMGAAMGLPRPLLFILVVLITTVVAIVFQKVILYPGRNLPHMNLVLISVGAMYIFQGAVLVIWGINPIVSEPFSGNQPINLFGAKIATQSLWVLGITLILAVLLSLFFSRTILGKAMRSVAEKREFVGIVGINANTIDTIAFGLAGAIGAIAGLIIAPLYPFEHVSGLMVLAMTFCAVIIGGLGNVIGGLVGGLVVGMLLAIGAGFFSGFKEVMVFVMLLIILSFRPQGILGGKRE